ncbi:MAG: hypothetical protein COW73_10875 [Nitrospirae bacterium CG18_big_fil_WC_8_21_14_2_50_70_55]|nr:MAG: hypothetical protein AUK30_09620 [Nitrospirae bacterium CG2_30_70_394]PIQ03480.1 MAG: hypothetical protein COW73_10875 [Nitrospirae bacterium CG18_big_fil_WC_8_21_14_2_50_70_55]PIU77571.1 MAG: hypothetical protein COS73_09970 [Nitrospirae bacterium CG06_land_8_20_14_3_00_70_43]PIW82301.1 MAG: hypothetical protein COZ96_09515 [Nitrospirae bacterium CG_4_8_14_3_um_filter_70_85]PIX82676.1 MAG: hypothetical protein COZ33_09375 [Nitrospirae bacterium CG_4_10_14_3_um_filter_70_108]PJB97129.1
MAVAALWVGTLAAALLPPGRLACCSGRAALGSALRVRAAVGWGSLTAVTISGLALAPVTVPAARFRLAFGPWFAAKLAVVALLLFVYVILYFRHHLALRALVRAGADLEATGEAGYHLRRMNLYTGAMLVLAVAAIFLIELAEYA